MSGQSYDESYKDQKYFVDEYKYNCPYCNRRHVSYSITDRFDFDWSREKKVYGYIIRCDSCNKESLHLSDFRWEYKSSAQELFEIPPVNLKPEFAENYNTENLDKYFFYRKPTSFFVIDNRIPEIIRRLISEAEGCKDIGYMTGASGALRKAIYKFLKQENLTEDNYEDKIKALKKKYPMISEEYIDALSNVQGMVSTELHEDFDFEPWTSKEFSYLVSSFRELMVEVYVKPEERKEKLTTVLKLNPFNRALKTDSTDSKPKE